MQKKRQAPTALNKICMLEACVADLEYIIPWRVKEDFQV